MKNITAQYRDLQEGKMTKANFMANVRMQFPDYISPVNSYEDMVNILKSKRILSEMRGFGKWAMDDITPEERAAIDRVVSKTTTSQPKGVEVNPDNRQADIKQALADMLEAGLIDSGTYMKAIQALKNFDTKSYTRKAGESSPGGIAAEIVYSITGERIGGTYDGIDEAYEQKAFYLVDETGDIIDSVMAVDSQEASDYFEKEYEGIGSSLTVLHTSSPDELRGGVAEDVNPELEAAKEQARRNSEEGYVQHVNKTKYGYTVEDWYDSDNTVASYENGEQINETTKKDIEALRAGALREAVEKPEGSYKKVTGKDLYSFFNEIDRLNPYEVRKGINIEMGMQYKPTPNYFTDDFNPESLAKATRKVLKNLQKDPAYYTNMISLPTEKRTNMLQKPKEIKVKPDGHTKIKGFTDAKSNTETNLVKKERAKGSPEGVKEMKPSKKSMGGLKTMKSNDKLPKGVELMKEADLTNSPAGLNAVKTSDLAARAKEIYKKQEEERKKQNQKPKAEGEDMKAKLKELVMQEVKKRMNEKTALVVSKTATDKQIDQMAQQDPTLKPGQKVDIIRK